VSDIGKFPSRVKGLFIWNDSESKDEIIGPPLPLVKIVDGSSDASKLPFESA